MREKHLREKLFVKSMGLKMSREYEELGSCKKQPLGSYLRKPERP